VRHVRVDAGRAVDGEHGRAIRAGPDHRVGERQHERHDGEHRAKRGRVRARRDGQSAQAPQRLGEDRAGDQQQQRPRMLEHQRAHTATVRRVADQ
jgi:hypothetical protein